MVLKKENIINHANLLFWVDLEMTGLSDNQLILEIASLITNSNLDILDYGPEIIIKRSKKELSVMEEWSKSNHKKSGLLEKVFHSEISVTKAEKETLKFLKKWTPNNEKIPLCGNSIWVDRIFLKREMPKLESSLHYRMIDVSSIKELAYRWYGSKGISPKKKNTHRVLNDIIESVNELKWYKKNLYKP